jgi:hypothetical protein
MVEREQFYRPKINLYQITSTFVRQRMNVHFQYHKSKKVSHVGRFAFRRKILYTVFIIIPVSSKNEIVMKKVQSGGYA